MGRRIVVTGASSSIGLAVAERLAAPGDSLLLHACSHPERCGPLGERLGGNCRVEAADFADGHQLDRFCRQAGEPDILVNAAAVTATGLLAGQDDAAIERMLAVNVLATVRLCRTVLPGMVARRCGWIVNLSSVAARRGNRGQAVYAGTKGFVESFTRALAAEYGRKGVRVNCVAPGPVEGGSLGELAASAGAALMESVASPRLGLPGDVAAAVAFLCGEGGEWINGRVLEVDGGFSRGV